MFEIIGIITVTLCAVWGGIAFVLTVGERIVTLTGVSKDFLIIASRYLKEKQNETK